MPSIIIAGAGLAGAATAFRLVQRGATEVLVLEREALPGVHASGRNAAMVRRLVEDEATAALCRDGAAFIGRPLGLPEPVALRRTGSLLLASGGEVAALERAAERARSAGVEVEVLNAAAARARHPVLEGAGFERAFRCPADGVVDVAALLHGYLEAARRGGASVRFGEGIDEVVVEGGRVRAVRTSAGREVEAACLVNAAGPWAGPLARAAGASAIPMRPLRRHLFVAAPGPVAPAGAVHQDSAGGGDDAALDTRPSGHPPRPLFALSAFGERAAGGAGLPIPPDHPWVWDVSAGWYFRPEAGGVLLCACDEDERPPEDACVDPGAEVALAECMARHVPALAALGVRHRWAGLRTFAPDGRFTIGWDPSVGGFFWVAGLGGHGVTASAAVGELAAGLLLAGEGAAPSPSPFDPARFATA